MLSSAEKHLQNSFRDKKFCLTFAILCLACFVLHVYGVEKLYSPFLYPEEMGYWTNAATMVGYDWSPAALSGHMPWYTYGYSLTLVPLFLLFDNMVSMYRAAIVLNAVWATLSFVLCHSIARRFSKDVNPYWVLLGSFLVSIYSAYLHQSSIAITETFLYLIVWVLFWLFIRYEEKPTWRRGVWLGLAAAYVYLTHNRTVGILLAMVIVMGLMLVQRKASWKSMAAVALTVIVMLGINVMISDFLSENIWGSATKFSEDYSNNATRIITILKEWSGLKCFIKSFAGKYWYACTASLMLCFWGVAYAVQLLWKAWREKKGLPNTIAFYLLSYAAVTAISAVATTMFDTSTRRADYIIYGRYAECAVGVFLILGFIRLLTLRRESKRNRVILLTSGVVLYVISAALTIRYTDFLSTVNNGNLLWPTTQVNSTIGIFFYPLLGQYSLLRCTLFALLVATLIFLVFSLKAGKAQRVLQWGACALTAGCFVFTGLYSTSVYTNVNQQSNGNETFLALVETIETNLRDQKIFMESNNMFVYYDYQNQMIHNTIYPGSIEQLNEDSDYDVLIVDSGSMFEVPGATYRYWMRNGNYAVFCRHELADDLQLESIDVMVYDFGEYESFAYSGFSGDERTFRWTNASPAEVAIAALEPGCDYRCSILLQGVIPWNQLQTDSISGRIVLNHHEEKAFAFTLVPGLVQLTFRIPEEMLEEDGNSLLIYSDLWSPSDYGSVDTRLLGIDIDKITFEEWSE